MSRRRPAAASDLRERDLLGQLRSPVESPDQTDAIMRRLGYASSDGDRARRHQRRRSLTRGLTALATIALVGGAAVVYGGSNAVRGPIESSVPAALHNDLQRQQQRLHRGIRLLRELAPRPAAETPSAPVESGDGEIDDAAIGPVRWI